MGYTERNTSFLKPKLPKDPSEHGCCADKACTSDTCMALPDGKTCGHCVHERRCCLIFGHTPTDTYCDWFPRRFAEKPVQRIDGGAA